MPGEGGGGLGGIGAILGPAVTIVRHFIGGGFEKPSLSDVYGLGPTPGYVAPSYERAPPRIFAPAVAGPAGGGPLYAQQPTGGGGYTPQQSTATDILDAAARGIQRGLEIRALLELLLALFRKPQAPRPAGFYFGGVPVPYLVTPTYGGVSSGTDWLGGLSSLGSSAAQLISALRGGGGQAMPGGGFIGPNMIGSGINRFLGLEQTPMPGVTSGASSCPTGSPYRVGTQRAIAQRHFQINPSTGSLDLFKPAGRILLDSSDVAGWKKVKRFGRKFGRRVGGR